MEVNTSFSSSVRVGFLKQYKSWANSCLLITVSINFKSENAVYPTYLPTHFCLLSSSHSSVRTTHSGRIPSEPTWLKNSPGLPSTRERRGGKGKKAPPPPAESLSPSQLQSQPRQAQWGQLPAWEASWSSQEDQQCGQCGDTFPVPAPRNIKPAVPSKPEGISR